MDIERIIRVRPRTVFGLLAILLAVAAVLWVLWTARQVVSWVLVSIILALALNPAVALLQRRGLRRGPAVLITFVVALLVVAGFVALIVPTLYDQVTNLADKTPGYVDDLTKGRGRLGFLETKYHIVERVRQAIRGAGVSKLAIGAGAAVSVTKSALAAVTATVTVVFLTLFMLLEGPGWIERVFGLVADEKRDRWRRIGDDVYRTVGGYVIGNVLISIIAGTAAGIAIWLVGVPYALALALIVGLFDLIPLAGATVAAVLVVLVAVATQGATAAIILAIFFVVYQQVENQVLQPVVYGRTVQLSSLAILVAVLIGAQVAGVLGALVAIPIAGGLQVVLTDWRAHRTPGPAAAL